MYAGTRVLSPASSSSAFCHGERTPACGCSAPVAGIPARSVSVAGIPVAGVPARSIPFATTGRVGGRSGRGIPLLVTAATGGSKGFGKADDSKSRKPSQSKGSGGPKQDASIPGVGVNESAPDISGPGIPALPSRAATDDDRLFEERLREVRRQAEEKKRTVATRSVAPIDYDNPSTEPLVDTAALTKDLPAKIGIGIAATVFAAIFAFGDILPAPAPPSQQQMVDASGIAAGGMSDAQRKQKEDQVQEFEGRLAATPDNREALEGAAVLYADLGQYDKSAQRLEQLSKLAPEDPEVQRLLGEVRFELGDYSASAAAYRRALKVSPVESLEVLQGLTGALLADNKPQQAVDELLAARQRVAAAVEGEAEAPEGVADEVQVALLLGKAYAAWGKPGDAASVYDRLIAARPDDFRGYLAKGLFLKDNGNQAEADRMFLQARYLAPDQVKMLVDRLAKR
ncbi:hypothetical protein CLOM_g3839 [Closterium sp. NIES-68]|nr:hypothetical protein CLOM_g3839 [Closterium sp. NIES-68]GJP68152.1 hypothetical protein CLOP_g24892 [Closterium sp. NIES-67]